MSCEIHVLGCIHMWPCPQAFVRYLSKKGSETHANTSHYSRANVREVHEMHTTMVAVRMCIGNYTVHEIRDNTVAMGLRFCLHEVVAKNCDQFATFF